MYDTVKYAHAIIGAVALTTFWSAGLARKGSILHRWVGRTYLIAMSGIIVSGLVMAVMALSTGRTVIGSFLVYLLLITATAMWLSWRAIRDKQNFAAFTGPVFRTLMVLNGLVGIAILILGLSVDSILLAGFSAVGLISAWTMYGTIRNGPQHSLWWRQAHMDAMIGNAVATHIAFLSIGLPKLLPMLSGPALQNLAWFGPLAISWVARYFLRKRFPDGRPIQRSTTAPAATASA